MRENLWRVSRAALFIAVRLTPSEEKQTYHGDTENSPGSEPSPARMYEGPCATFFFRHPSYY